MNEIKFYRFLIKHGKIQHFDFQTENVQVNEIRRFKTETYSSNYGKVVYSNFSENAKHY